MRRWVALLNLVVVTALGPDHERTPALEARPGRAGLLHQAERQDLHAGWRRRHGDRPGPGLRRLGISAHRNRPREYPGPGAGALRRLRAALHRLLEDHRL